MISLETLNFKDMHIVVMRLDKRLFIRNKVIIETIKSNNNNYNI